MNIHAAVTDELIASGLRGNCGECPVALAIRDAIVGLADISVNGRYIAIRFSDVPRRFGGWWTDDNPAFRAPIPPAVGHWIDQFDHGVAVRPIAFDLVFEPADPTA